MFLLRGIYCIENILNGRRFMAYSKNVKLIFKLKYYQLQKGIFKNWKLQKDWNHFGSDNFKFYIIEEITSDEWIKRKQFYMDLFQACLTGYQY